ncbi:hypothetical protein [Microtetraspora glauca]|uniref:Uncharacterized protein n=1 Tax=Microtetraspora glauca TaxID=1996 RepID=A0ABV3GEW8_MICGL
MPHLPAKNLSWGDFVRLTDTTMRLKRQLNGDPTERVAVTSEADPLASKVAAFADLPPDQRHAQLAALAAMVSRRVSAASGGDDDDDEGE